ncbi:hypothetical protein LG634_30655 [Streptomyces bambusae]|uniref:hypothetical protein n=1 Tax=Streptomyces bambusae TaxID=1550616 RepID=UPI001CFF5519|nr:hypothetical protein [Streptomyces bambusae]MCB5169156.1 hypothetical protein [Streptomyces bambusae]
MTEHGEHTSHGGGAPAADPEGFHGMAVVGEKCVFLSHLPMTHTPHDYQVILRGSFGASDGAYFSDKQAHPESRIYTVEPEKFLLPDLFPGDDGTPPKRTSFKANLHRNHFEAPPAHADPPPVEILTGVRVEVEDVVWHHRFVPDAERPEELPYVLFGHGTELFVAHRITGPFRPGDPQEFDHLLTVGIQGTQLSADALGKGIPLTVTGRPNDPDGRLKEGETVRTVADLNGRPTPITLDVGSDLYFDTADLTPRHGHEH